MKILMVCLGNICRSPLAEGIMQDMIKKNNLEYTIESAGTSSFHVGEKPDPRSIAIAADNGIDISHQRSQLLTADHIVNYDLIFVMDKSNYRDAMELAKTEEQRNKIKLFLKYGESEVTEVPDPYYTKGFDYVFELINNASKVICKKLITQDLS
ncbi:UNVERIFIED_CONTAM: hypothetical protein GTU68_033095 [Idotea baltica]|nr:hypothetical protein [Idotea baltica]